MEGFLKIGKTTREPESRAKELSQATGVATPFYVAFSIQVADCHSAEEYVYTVLEHNGFQRTPNREFFRMPLRKAIEVLLLVEKHLQDEPSAIQTAGIAKDELANVNRALADGGLVDEQHPGFPIYCEAIETYYGLGDTLKDEDEAIRLLFKAKSLDFPAAYTDLGEYYTNKEPCNTDEDYLERDRRALEILKEGASKGHGRCFINMAGIFLIQSFSGPPFPSKSECQLNANKCWRKYFFSQTFANDDDDRWTKEIKHSLTLQTAGCPRRIRAWEYLRLLALGDLQLDEDIKRLLLPLRDDILRTTNIMLILSQECLSKSNSPEESKKARAALEKNEVVLRFIPGYLIASEVSDLVLPQLKMDFSAIWVSTNPDGKT